MCAAGPAGPRACCVKFRQLPESSLFWDTWTLQRFVVTLLPPGAALRLSRVLCRQMFIQMCSNIHRVSFKVRAVLSAQLCVQHGAEGTGHFCAKHYVDTAGNVVQFTILGQRIVLVGGAAEHAALMQQQPFMPKPKIAYSVLNTMVRILLHLLNKYTAEHQIRMLVRMFWSASIPPERMHAQL